jgi:L-threonylcarbamoyladenylate synthase
MVMTLSNRLIRQIDEAGEIIRKGGVIAFPTDTVYGLGANPYIVDAVRRIYKIKQRPQNLPLPILLADESGLDAIVTGIPRAARLLMQAFWPGGLTLVLPKADSFPASAGESSVAVRIPDYEITRTLIRKAGVPVVGTSANVSSRPSALDAGEVREQLGDTIDMIIDGGRCPGGVESTVVDLTGNTPVVLREGAIAAGKILKLLRR